MKLNLPPKLVEKKTSFGSQLFCFVKFSFSVTGLMPNYAETGRSFCENFIHGNIKRKKELGLFQKGKITCTGHFCFFEVLSHLWRIDSA